MPTYAIPGWNVLYSRDASFWVEGNKFGLKTPVAVGHTAADAVVITPGGTCHVVDVLHLDRLSFVDLSVVQSFEGMIQILNYLGGLAEEGV